MLGRFLRKLTGPKVPEFRMPAEDELTTTASGLQFVLLKPGNGQSPTAHDQVTVRYAGWLKSGRLFDASYPRTATFPLTRVIAGWTEGVQLLMLGGEALFVIPGELAYGARGAPPMIGPGATLVFRIELVKIG
jgi:FKBP-type peptidyl-prolyl cis-trans isomerase